MPTDPVSAPVELYRSATARVLRAGDVTGRPCVVTFWTWAEDEASHDAAAGLLAGPLFAAGGVAVHVINRANHWWQIDDLDACLAAAREAAAPAARRVGLGASMGGYAVLRFARALGLDEVLAFAPQLSIDRARAPWERRWAAEAARLDFTREDMVLPEVIPLTLVYDPQADEGADLRHADAIAATNPRADLRRIEVPGAGHLVLQDFRARGLLRRVVRALAAGVVPADDIRAAAGR